MSVQELWSTLIQPLLYPLQPQSRLFWLFCVSAFVIGWGVTFYRARAEYNFKAAARLATLQVVSPRHWLHKSTITDIGLLTANGCIRALILVPLLGSHLYATLIVTRFLQGNLGNAPEWALPGWLVIAVFSITFFVVEDFSRFGLHRLMHKVPLLWRWHRVHHSAHKLTPLTLFRVHPLEMTLYYLRGMMVFGLVSGVFVYLFGGQLSGWQVLGVDLLGFTFNLLGANLRHSHIWVSFGRCERWFISPAQHQIHHSSAAAHRDKNFGACLALWDQLFRSHVRTGHSPLPLSFGASPRA